MYFQRVLDYLPNFNKRYRPVVDTLDDFKDVYNGEHDGIVDSKISSKSAFLNVCNSIQGVAILAMPYVIKGGGWWSVLAMLVVAALSNYTGQILIKCHYEELQDDATGENVLVRVRSSYADIGDSIWPHYGKHLVLSVQVLELLFMATLYPIVAASVMRGLLPRLRISSGLWVLVFGLLMLPNIFFRKLYHISIMSTLTVVSAGCISVVLTLYCFTQAGTWQTYDLNEFDLKEFVASVGVMVASYSSQMYLSIIECDMKKPKDAPLVMNAGYFAMTALKIGVGVIAYMTFGENTHEVVTLNLPTGMILTAVNIVVVILSLSSYTLPMFTVFEILEKDSPWLVTGDIELSSEKELKNLDEETKQSYIAIRRTLVRLALVIVTLIMAVSVPHFGLVLSFIGSFTGAFLEMVFPSLFYVILKHERISTVTIVLNILIVGFSMLFMGVGIYFSGTAMVKAFKLHTREVWTID